MTSSTTSTWLVQPDNGGRNAVLVARAMVDPKAGKISIRILNPRNESDCPKGKSNCSNEATTGGCGAFGLHIFHRADPPALISQWRIKNSRGRLCWMLEMPSQLRNNNCTLDDYGRTKKINLQPLCDNLSDGFHLYGGRRPRTPCLICRRRMLPNHPAARGLHQLC